MRPGYRLFAFALLAALVTMGGTGCALYRPEPPMEVAAGLAKSPALEKIRSGAATTKDLQAAFPKIERVTLNMRFEAQRSVWLFFKPKRLRTLIDVSMASDGSPTNARLQGRQIGSQLPLYELATEGTQMRVAIPSANMFFEGPIPPGGTEFHNLFGIEPWDLAALATAASRIAWAEPKWLPARESLKLRPGKPDILGLQFVEFDLATGLPSASHWRRGSSSWTARYRSWDLHSNSARGPANSKAAWIVPTHISVESRQPRATIELTLRRQGEAYIMTINPPQLSPQTFKLQAKPGATTFSLDFLKELFSVDSADVLKELLKGG